VVRPILCLFLCLGAAIACAQEAPQRSTVYVGGDPALMNGYTPNPVAVSDLTDQLILAATGQKTIAAAWRTLVKPTDRIGIKIAAAGGRDFSTHAPIVQALLRGLVQAGIPASHVVIWDRPDPAAAGYHSAPGGPAVRHIEPFTGYDPRSVATIPSVGRLIWGDAAYVPRGPGPLQPAAPEQYSADSHWSKVICGVNKIINIPVMSSSEDCGLAGCIYNVTIPNVDNWRRFISEPECGDPYLCELYSDAHAGPKVVLNIMDGLIAQYGGGPAWQPHYSWAYSTLYVSKDPVAIDATALRLLELWRKEARLPSLTQRARYLNTAADMGLGVAQPEQINLVQVVQ
jgi:hypothetical protein